MNPRLLSRLFFLVVFAAIVWNCKKDEEPVVSSEIRLIASPDTLLFYNSDSIKHFYLSSIKGVELNYQVSSIPTWLTVSKTSGKVSSSIEAIQAVAVINELPQGVYKRSIEIISNIGGKTTVVAILSVNANPILTVTPNTLSPAATVFKDSVLLKNTGKGYLGWELESAPNWLTVSNSYGYLEQGQQDWVKINYKKSGLVPGDYSGKIAFRNTFNNKLEEVTVNMNVPEFVALESSPSSLFIEAGADSKAIFIKNTGNSSTPASWSISGLPSYLQVNPSNGSIARGDSVQLTFSVERSALTTTGNFSSEVNLNYNAGTLAIPATVANLVQKKFILSSDVVDAEMNKISYKIVFISSSDKSLSYLDPETQALAKISFSYIPICVSVSPDGMYAAVGHDSKVSIVNLSTMVIKSTFSVSCEALDIVLTSTYAYVFPKRDQWEEVRCINLSNGVESLSSGGSIYAGSLGKLDPSGKYIYSADNGLSPADIEKADATAGTLKMMYDSPYHGDYPLGGNLWFLEDGKSLVSKYGVKTTVSEIKSQDMIYDGKLTLPVIGEYNSFIQAFDHDLTTDNIFLVAGASQYSAEQKIDSAITVYNGTGLFQVKRLPLESYLANNGKGTTVPARGKFLFASPNGTKVYVLTEAPLGYGIANRFALQVIENK